MDEVFLQLQKDIQNYAEDKAQVLGLVRPNTQLLITVTIKRVVVKFLKVVLEFSEPITSQSGPELRQRLDLAYNPDDLLRKIQRRSNAGALDGINGRLYLAFQNLELFDLFAVVQQKQAQILAEKNIGQKSLAELNQFLESLNLRLGMRLPPDVIEWCQAKRKT